MNAANYNWTESINRASDKPGEVHPISQAAIRRKSLIRLYSAIHAIN
jgi:hypothetical protein